IRVERGHRLVGEEDRSADRQHPRQTRKESTRIAAMVASSSPRKFERGYTFDEIPCITPSGRR
ncbi:MAG: hypothetical protein LBD06_06290, partial [Candidatus Accumulibacter sp.]|nr:hypothetical protein [Accumulibacter sp.]